MEGINYNVSYEAYYLNIFISKTDCFFFDWDNLNIYTNISEFFGDSKMRGDAIKYFKDWILSKVEYKYRKEALDELNFHVNYMYNNRFVAYGSF